MIDKLRDEIIESEKARTDMMKWKLILVAAIGAASLGIGSSASPAGHPWVLLALVPFVCLYVDALCFHTEIRIMSVAQFLRTRAADSVERQYEEYCTQNRSHFSLEAFALLVTTVGLSGLVLVIGLSQRLQNVIGMGMSNETRPENVANVVLAGKVLACSGGVGIIAGIVFYVFYRCWTNRLDRPVTPLAS
ncbi:MAG: hypothetical protein H8K10_09020 [Nitrospira sp.]|nr:hypothetical protein [Nitrospira sp.]